jgi:hypothetical protein
MLVILILILIVIEYEYVNDARHSAWSQFSRETPIPCGENGVDKALRQAQDRLALNSPLRKSHAKPGSTTFIYGQRKKSAGGVADPLDCLVINFCGQQDMRPTMPMVLL